METDGQAVRLDGKQGSRAVVARLRAELAQLPWVPNLTFVRVGSDPASVYYVRSKARVAEQVGIHSETVLLRENVSQAELLSTIRGLSADDDVDGILLQLPLPDHLDERSAIDAILPSKDVDGLSPVNVGRLWSGQEGLVPATPLGIIELLDQYDIEIGGREAVIIGRSNLVGKPLAALLLKRNATVTFAHSKTRELGRVTRRADILVAAAGHPRLVMRDMVAKGAAVLDVGLTRVEGRIVGDVDPGVTEVAGWLTPMPGGTGPMTVVMVIANTLKAARLRRGLP